MSFIIPPLGNPPRPKGELVPDHARQAKLKATLRGAGGRRTSFNLTPQAAADIEHIKTRDGLDTATDAVIAALRRHAKSKR